MKKLAEKIILNTETKDKTAICFLGYYTLFMTKTILQNQENINQNDMYKYLERPLTHTKNKDTFILKDKIIRNSFKLNNISEVLKSIDTLLNLYKNNYSKIIYNKIKKNWDDLGLDVLKEEAKTNLNGINKVVSEFDSINNFNIEKLIDLFEELNVSDKFFNDFFTPNSITKMIGKFVNKIEFKNKEINIYDPSCGIGRLLYHSFVKLKEKYPNKTINIFGIDLNNRFKVFTESIFNLINYNNVYINYEDTLKAKIDLPIIDICVSNPPYNKKNIELDFVKHIKDLGCQAYIILPTSFNSTKKAEPLRESLMDNNLLKTVIQLPSKMFKDTNIQTIMIEINHTSFQKLERLFIKNKITFNKINFDKNVSIQINELKPKEEEKKEINLLKQRNEIDDLIEIIYKKRIVI